MQHSYVGISVKNIKAIFLLKQINYFKVNCNIQTIYSEDALELKYP